MVTPTQAATKTAMRSLANIQRTFDVIAARPGINSAQLCEALGVPKTTGMSWAVQLVLQGSVERRRGKRKQRGSDPDTFIVIGDRPGMPRESKLTLHVAPEDRIKRNFVKAKNCGMASDPLALPMEFFARRVAA